MVNHGAIEVSAVIGISEALELRIFSAEAMGDEREVAEAIYATFRGWTNA